LANWPLRDGEAAERRNARRNADRLHSALGCKSPVVFEADVRKAEASNRMIATAWSPN